MLLKNLETEKIIEFASHQGEGWGTPNYLEIADHNLSEAKSQKIVEMKRTRDLNNILPVSDQKAFVIDSEGSVSSREEFFVFYADRHAFNPAADPTAILTSVLVRQQPIHYSSTTLSGERIVVSLTTLVAMSIVNHLGIRNDTNYRLYNAIEAAISSCKSVEEVNAISWNVSYLE